MLYGTEMNFMPNSVKFCLSYGMKLSLISVKFEMNQLNFKSTYRMGNEN